MVAAATNTTMQRSSTNRCFRLRNDLYCVGWGVKLYSLTHQPLFYVCNYYMQSLLLRCCVQKRSLIRVRRGST